MNSRPLILVVGGDTLTERVYAELTGTTGHEVRVVWPITARPDEALKAAGVDEAASLLALASDDALNLVIALRARVLNPTIRIVLRQFNPVLGAKIEQNLTDCTALSPAAHSAATYAGAALDPGCFFALRFPAEAGPLLGFAQTSADALEAVGSTVVETEERLGLRVVALSERLDPPGGALISAGDAVVTFGPVVEHAGRHRERAAHSSSATGRLSRRIGVKGFVAGWERLNPVLRVFLLAAAGFFFIRVRLLPLRFAQDVDGGELLRRRNDDERRLRRDRRYRQRAARHRRGDCGDARRDHLHQHLHRLREFGAHPRAVDGATRHAADTRARTRDRLRRRQDRQRRHQPAYGRRKTRRRDRVESRRELGAARSRSERRSPNR